MGGRYERQSEIIKEIKEDNVPLSFVLIFVNWRFYICQVTKIQKYFPIFKLTKICIIIEMTPTNSHGMNSDSKVIGHY